ncbi:MAG TPA: response regulator transcription factor [Lacipirellula sp.]
MAKTAGGRPSRSLAGQRIRRGLPSIDPSIVTLAENCQRTGRLKFLVVVSNAFDFRAFTALFHLLPDVELSDCLKDLNQAASACKALQPDVAILSLSFANELAYSCGRDLLQRDCVQCAAFFDANFAIWRAYKALSIGPRVRYFTRDFDANDLCRRLRTNLGSADSSFLSDTRQLSKYDSRGLLNLSSKELQVVQWLAWGHSVRSVAEKLGLAESTIDNHKCRAMKKLNVHRSTDLLRLAIEAGLVDK